jgi:transposase
MPQLRRPLFPSGATVISAVLSFCRTDDTVTYFHCDMPVFSHGKDDRAAFRLITAQLHITSGVKQVDLAQAFGISNITVKRAVKLYRSSGAAGFFAERISRGATVLTEPVMQQAQSQLDAGLAPRAVAILLAIKPDTLMKAIRAGRLRILVKKTIKTAHSPALKQTSPTSPAKVIAQSKTAAPPWGEVRAMLSLE